MNKLLEDAFAAMDEAGRAAGYKPQTEAELAKVQATQAQLMYALARNAGVPVQEALRAKRAMAGDFGAALIAIAFREQDHDE